jgi:lantibiotic modifying enzyme
MTLAPDIKIISSGLNHSLTCQIDVIVEQVIEKKNEVNDVGLLSGKAGIVLLFTYLSKVFPEKHLLNNVYDYLDEISNILADEALPYNLSSGVAGIAFVFQHLRNMGVLDVKDDLNLQELDEFISLGADHDFKSGNWDPLHGMTGSGIYFLERNKETGEKKFLEKIVDHLANMRTNVGEYRVWITPGYEKYSNDNYNFGMAHGMPGILSFLAQAYSRGIRQDEIEEMISSCLSFLLQYEYSADAICCFPAFIDLKDKEDKEHYSRHAWCYGDLCMANALIHCGKALHNEEWLNKGIEVALKTTLRSFENSGCVDAPFCHGTVGLVHQYNRFYQLTSNKVFKHACENWLNITKEQFYKEGEGAGGYYFRTYNEEKDIFELISQYGLLEGSAGIALVYLSCVFNINPDWDIIFLTNV